MYLPSGTVTFLFTDIEGSTKLWEAHPEAMRLALARHDELLRQAIEGNNGIVFKTVGDAFCAAFATAPDALTSALAVQVALHTEPWPEELALRVRIALHTGAAELRDNDYFGQPLNRVARLLWAGHGGQVLLSLPTEELTRDTLLPSVTLQDLGQHRLRDLTRPEHVFQLLHPDLPDTFPPLRSLDNPDLPNNMPLQMTSFIGRDKEIAEVKSLLAKTRLLTLTGSGGCGKTRLALQVAADALEHYPDGVWLVELAPLADPALVPQTVASVLGLAEQAVKSYTLTLIEHLKDKRLLLVLDNCEHLLSACAVLSDDLLRACPSLKILASSREGLGIGGELTYRVPSLSLPDLRQTATPSSLSPFEAVQLFVERALFYLPTFVVTTANAPALASVCHRLDGIPLAIELAAARVRSLAVEEINSKLDNRFRLLTGGSRASLPRQQTLRALVDWSYDLLNVQERTLLCRLAVFAGGWTLEAAEQVCVGEGMEAWEVLDVLTSLVDKSLVVTDPQEERTRYRLLETVRQYARDRLVESGESLLVRARHGDCFLKLAEKSEQKIKGPEGAAWLQNLETEHDNLRAALDFCLDSPEGAEAGLRLAGALMLFWWTHGHLSEGRERLAAVLARPEAQETTQARAHALKGAGVLALMQSDYTSAHFFYAESVKQFRELGYKPGLAYSLNGLGNVILGQGDYAAARVLCCESLTLYRELGDKWGIAISLSGVGNVSNDQGDYTAARALYEESLAMQRELGNKKGIAMVLCALGRLIGNQNDCPAADTCFRECLTICREIGDMQTASYALEGCADLPQRQSEEAIRLYGAARKLRGTIGSPLPPDWQEGRLAALRVDLGEDASTAAWTQGQAMTLEQAIECALGNSAS